MKFLNFIFLFLASNVVFASEGQGQSIKIIYSLFNFSLLVLILFYILRNPIKDFFKERSILIQKGMKEANLLKEKADQQIEEFSVKMKRVEEEVTKIIEDIKHEGELEKTKIIKDAFDMGERLKLDTQKLIEQEYRKASEKLKKEVVDLSIRLASEKIKQNMSETQQSIIVQKYLGKMESIL